MNRMDRRFAFLQVSAEAHLLNPQIIGLGVVAWWPDGLGIKINALRQFVRTRVADDDILIFCDAFDVIVFGDEAEIVDRFQELEESSNHSLFFNAEMVCYPDLQGVCDSATYPEAPFQWRFLNSGLLAGRGHALKRMLRDPAPDVIHGSDQFWYQKYFRAHPDEIQLDYHCKLLCGVWGVGEEHGAEMTQDRRVYIPQTKSSPPLVHFVSVSHWTVWRHGKATSTMHEVFQQLFPKASAELLDGWWIGAQIGCTHDIKIYGGPGYWSTMRCWLCIHCNLLGSPHGECAFFEGFLGERCWFYTLVEIPLVLVLTFLVWRYCIAVRFRKAEEGCAWRMLDTRDEGGAALGVARGAPGSPPTPVSMQARLRRCYFWLRMQLRLFEKRPESLV
mmetsp:Transcript_50362/g.142793  ORF Transcript_50362/g.142793 Transcript_50362/m.142793 type:complete len:389 (-) Transcript_50362:80-1246(-)